MVQVLDDFFKFLKLFLLLTPNDTIKFVLQFLNIVHRLDSIKIIRDVDIFVECLAGKVLLSLTDVRPIDFSVECGQVFLVNIELEIHFIFLTSLSNTLG